jgi:hypothetical protein
VPFADRCEAFDGEFHGIGRDRGMGRDVYRWSVIRDRPLGLRGSFLLREEIKMLPISELISGCVSGVSECNPERPRDEIVILIENRCDFNSQYVNISARLSDGDGAGIGLGSFGGVKSLSKLENAEDEKADCARDSKPPSSNFVVSKPGCDGNATEQYAADNGQPKVGSIHHCFFHGAYHRSQINLRGILGSLGDVASFATRKNIFLTRKLLGHFQRRARTKARR